MSNFDKFNLLSIIGSKKNYSFEDLITVIEAITKRKISVAYEIIETKDSLSFYDYQSKKVFISKNLFIDIFSENEVDYNKFTNSLYEIFYQIEMAKIFKEIEAIDYKEIISNNPNLVLIAKEIVVNLNKGKYNNSFIANDYISSNLITANSIKEMSEFLSFFAPNQIESFLKNYEPLYIQSRDNLISSCQNFENEKSNLCKVSLICDSLVFNDINILSQFPILKILYNENGLRKDYHDLNNEFSNNNYRYLLDFDLISIIENKIAHINEGRIIGRNSSASKNESEIIVDLVEKMDSKFYNFIKNLIDNKIKYIQFQKMLINKELNEPNKTEEEILDNRRKWLKESEIFSRQQELLVNLYNSILAYENKFNEIHSENEVEANITKKDAQVILKEFLGIEKIEISIVLSDLKMNHTFPNLILYNNILNKIDAELIVITSSNLDINVKSEKIIYLEKIKKSLFILFPKINKDKIILSAISVLENLYLKLEDEKLENFDRIFILIDKLSNYLNSVENKYNEFEEKGINISCFDELIINGCPYVKCLKKPQNLEMERVMNLMLINDDVSKNKLNQIYDNFICLSISHYGSPELEKAR